MYQRCIQMYQEKMQLDYATQAYRWNCESTQQLEKCANRATTVVAVCQKHTTYTLLLVNMVFIQCINMVFIQCIN